uniref:Polyisoprenoid diphosphate/phosphate phosphohydrolase PLPP6 n=1 Tax=Coturnix japonica TaxID=93934 RepID=A0A8C2UG65_COTJA
NPGSEERARGREKGNLARPEFASLLSQRGPAAPDSPSRRRESAGPAPPALPDEDCMRLNPSFVGIALSSLLAVDLWASKRLGVCAGEASAWGSARPLLKVVEVSGHGIPWLLGTLYGLCQSDSSAAREVLLNLLFAHLLTDVLTHKSRPWMSAVFSLPGQLDKYSFPSGHATRAALVCRFVLHHLVLAVPLRVLVVLWVLIVGISRVMLGRHNVTDVLFGLFLGYVLYSVVEYCWLSPLNAPALFALWSH